MSRRPRRCFAITASMERSTRIPGRARHERLFALAELRFQHRREHDKREYLRRRCMPMRSSPTASGRRSYWRPSSSANGDDGVVAYRSAHLDGVESGVSRRPELLPAAPA
jgi:hypothetical protein